VERLLADDSLRGRLATMGTAIQAERGTEKAADLIERLALTGEPVRG
jgi:UDP:flavonoid glycosyltransferase YjiC (YdhE family)